MIDTDLIDEPLPPALGDCCGGGSCCPCVWDYYYEQRRLWLAQQLAAEAQTSQESKS